MIKISKENLFILQIRILQNCNKTMVLSDALNAPVKLQG